ncbi:MAG: energy-coupled thiamine transporter ThiT [Acutalibacteraceae bacterium]|nr:energy-coupled thiamine transporter ThiT [Oscillospiraceae bacterium]
MTKKNKTFRLTVTAVMIALGTVLSMITFYKLPFGGSVTVFSMLPLLMVGYMFGVKWGMFSGLVYGILQCVIGSLTSTPFASQKAINVVFIIILDYLVAFTVIGTSGMFKKRIKSVPVSFALGSLVAMLLRFVSHFVSGVLFFGSWAEWYFTQDGFPAWGQRILESFGGLKLSMIYSFIYQASYLVPEIIITIVVGVIIANIKPIKKYLVDGNAVSE